MTPTASVLIRTKDEADHLPSTLEAVFAQNPSPQEVLVIDSGSSDGTLVVARTYPVKIIEIDQRTWSYPRALNIGAREATGEVLICLSAHCVPMSEKWLESLLLHFEDPIVAGVWGPSHPPGRPAPPASKPERQLPGSYGVHNRMWGLSNANSAIRRSLWLEFPFDESLPAAEDKAWSREAMARGYHIVHEPAAGVWHATHSPGAAYRRNHAVAEGFALMFPELHGKPTGVLTRIVGAGINRFRANVTNPSVHMLRRDLSRIPTLVAAILGEKASRRRSQRNRVREDMPRAPEERGKPSPGDPGSSGEVS